MNISKPDTSSGTYLKFIDLVNDKVKTAMSWLEDHKIEYVWNSWIDGHLYRLYIPAKDVLFDFECYPVRNLFYEYIRVNYNTDITKVLESLFPETVINTQDLWVFKQPQLIVNKFLRKNEVSPVYDKNVLRFSWVKDTEMYQCIIGLLLMRSEEIVRYLMEHI